MKVFLIHVRYWGAFILTFIGFAITLPGELLMRFGLRPRLLWASTQDGTAIRVDAPRPHYEAKEPIAKVKHKPTEAEDNAAGRVIRRRQNKRLRGWMPHAKR